MVNVSLAYIWVVEFLPKGNLRGLCKVSRSSQA